MADSRFSEEELAERAGASPEFVRRLAELEIIVPVDEEGRFQPPDIQRVRLVQTLDASGIPIDIVGKAVSAGHLTFAFLGLIWPEPVAVVPGTTLGQHAQQLGVSFETVQRAREALGLPRGLPDHPVRQDDAEMTFSLLTVLTAGFTEESVTAHNRLLGESLRRVAASQVQLFHAAVEEPMLSAGLTQQQILHFASQLGLALAPMVEKVMLTLYRRHLEHYILEDLVAHLEDAIQKVGLARRRRTAPSAVAFFEIESPNDVLEDHGAQLAGARLSLGDFVEGAVAAFGGRPIKLVANSLMIHFPDPAGALPAALELLGRAAAESLPPARAGIDAGVLVLNDGDLFGTPVKVAHRIACYARWGEVLITEGALSAAGGRPEEHEGLGPVGIGGLRDPITLFAGRPGPQ